MNSWRRVAARLLALLTATAVLVPVLGGVAAADEVDLAAPDTPAEVREATEYAGEAGTLGEDPPAPAAPQPASDHHLLFPCLPDTRIALLQDNVPWLQGNFVIDPFGLGANGIELRAQGADFCILESADLGSFDLGQFTKIIISSAQNQTFYNRLFPGGTVHPDLEAWVAGGGLLIAQMADVASGPGAGGTWSGGTFVGGVGAQRYFTQDNDILDSDHPVVSGELPCLSLNCGRLIDLEFFVRFDIDDWNWSSHGHFTNLPFSARQVLTDGVGPALVEYRHGAGTVLASMVTTEWRYLGGFSAWTQNRKLLANILSYLNQADCTDDNDCDGIPNDEEIRIGTDPDDADTDGDGLVDPWEVDPSVEGAGFKSSYPDGVDLGITQDEVFGPYGNFCAFPDGNLRVSQPYDCNNRPPDPRHVDIYFEMDWQDCREDGCPDVFGLQSIGDLEIDPVHHSPNIIALGRLVNEFRRAPVANPDGETGVNLHILVDESIRHTPNCDQDESEVRDEFFGTEAQRTGGKWAEIRRVREQAVRYIWSGHSTFSEGGCPNPDFFSFVSTGMGARNIERYDFSPFGDVNRGGRDLLMTMGPLWSCAATIGTNGPSPGPCFRQVIFIQPLFGEPVFTIIPGIFPNEVNTPTGEIDVPRPIAMMLGLSEQQGTQQLWARGLARLIGQSLGFSQFDVANLPELTGLGAPGEKTVRPVDRFAVNWNTAVYAPNGNGLGRTTQPFPLYRGLAALDSDGDGEPEGTDNCPGVPNPDQDDTNINGFGDACDWDIDGDGVLDRGGNGARNLAAVPAFSPDGGDPFPYDTDNDGIDNVDDPDDDNDGIDDVDDNCVLVRNVDQADLDGDGAGDVCDLDRDDDGTLNQIEDLVGSDPEDGGSVPEFVGSGDSCADGLDNDGDGLVDGADEGCIDADGDTLPDHLDNCPATPNYGWYDADDDGLGDACDATPDGEGEPTLWATDGHAVFEIDLESEAVIGGFDDGNRVAALAPGASGGELWAYGDGTLRRYDLDGAQTARYEVPGAGANPIWVGLEPDPVDGGVWLVVKNDVWRLGPNGGVLATATLGEDATDLAVAGGTAWLTTKKDLVALDGNGDVVTTVDLPPSERPRSVTVAGDGTVWVTTPGAARRYDPAGNLLGTVADLDDASHMAAAPDGGVYAALDDEVALVDATGAAQWVTDPDPSSSGPNVVDVEALGGDAVAAYGTTVALLSGGAVTAVVDTAEAVTGNLVDVEVVGGDRRLTEAQALEVVLLAPFDGDQLAATEVTVQGIVSEPAEVLVDGQPVPVDASLTFETVVPLPAEGPQTIVATASSTDGIANDMVTVVRDTIAPDPIDPAAITDFFIGNNLFRVRGAAGSAEPGALVIVDNLSLPGFGLTAQARADDDGSWSVDVPAVFGNQLGVTTSDLAGNESAQTVIAA